MTFYEELTVATVGSLLGSIVGALVGALAAWFFSRRLFEDEARAEELSERTGRRIARRLVETEIAEAWERKMTGDFEALRSIQKVLTQVTVEGSVYTWSFERHASPGQAPVLIGPLRDPARATSDALSKVYLAVRAEARACARGTARDSSKTDQLMTIYLNRRLTLKKALGAELTELTELTVPT
jgi:hypothetical protein